MLSNPIMKVIYKRLILISQHFKAITPAFRDNCQIVLVFYSLDESDWDVVSKSFLPRLTKEKRN